MELETIKEKCNLKERILLFLFKKYTYKVYNIARIETFNNIYK